MKAAFAKKPPAQPTNANASNCQPKIKPSKTCKKPSTPRNAKPPKARNNCKARSWNLISSKA